MTDTPPPAVPLSTTQREPLLIRAAVTTAVTAVVHVAVVVGLVHLDAAAETSIGAAVDALGLVVLLVWTRPAVTANAKVIARVTDAGQVVAGAAATLEAGTALHVDQLTPSSPVVVAAKVNPDLVAPAG